VTAVIGQDAQRLSRHSAIWHRLREARGRARDADDQTLLAYARDDVSMLAYALSECLTIHEPRDGSPYCPQCSAHGGRVIWPCPVWQRVEVTLGQGGW
jgi:hypothetical protein